MARWFAGWFGRRIGRPIKGLLRQGLDDRRLALAAAVGVTLSVAPVFGVSTALCVLVATCLRLNLPAIQLANAIALPAHVALALPLLRLGERMLGADPLQLAPAEVNALMRSGLPAAADQLGWSLLHALTAWAFLAPLAGAGIYFGVLILIRRYRSRLTEPRPADAASP